MWELIAAALTCSAVDCCCSQSRLSIRNAMQSRLILRTSDCRASGLSRRLHLSRGILFLPSHKAAVSWRQALCDKRGAEVRGVNGGMLLLLLNLCVGWSFFFFFSITLSSCLFPYYCPANSSAMKSCEGGFMPVNTIGLRGSRSSCCSACEGGTYRPHLSLVLHCLPCPAGYFCPPGTHHVTLD